MTARVSIGAQDFVEMREERYFYVDKTAFIERWWSSGDKVTLVCRPRRFGKTLTLSTVEAFFSHAYAGRGEELFGGLAVWEDAGMRALQGSVPVISVSFAKVKERDRAGSMAMMKRVLRTAVHAHDYLSVSEALNEDDRAFLARVRDDMDDETAADCLNQLCSMLERHWGAKPIVLLDEYDTPMQEAWLGGYLDEMTAFIRSLFNATFKTNPALGRALITGVTRVSRESIFSDLNNLSLATVMTGGYEDCFGFTEDEVFEAMDEFGLADKAGVKHWYDGFTIGATTGIYNPWSITYYLREQKLLAYWANTSSNALVSTIVRKGGPRLKEDFETLLAGGTVHKMVDEHVTFADLGVRTDAVWSLLVCSGYLRADEAVVTPDALFSCELTLTNREVLVAFDAMVRAWFGPSDESYGEFSRALLAGDLKAANAYLNDVTLSCMSSFDTGNKPSGRSEPERFYHGLVLGLLVDLRGRYVVESNRESGFGRYDVALVPRSDVDPAIIVEFKVFDPDEEQALAQTVERAKAQIEQKAYAASLIERGIAAERIRTYGIAFEGKRALIG